MTDRPGASGNATQEPASDSSSPVERDRALTLTRDRLKGSPACLNCGTPLRGPFCHYCGQPDRNLMRFFPVLMRELMEDFIDFDSRFMRTLRPLLFHPGRLTRDYLQGRRFRYTPPLRLYIFSSMVFFILAATLAGNAIDVSVSGDGRSGIQLRMGEVVTGAVEEELQLAVEAGTMTAEEAVELNSAVKGAIGAPEGTTQEKSDSDNDSIMIDGEPWDRASNPFIIPGMPDVINVWINDEIEDSPRKGREIAANPTLIIDQIFEVLPIAVFIMLPAVAMLFKFWYLFARRYYVEHLIHALHNHAFLFVLFTLSLLADSIADWLDPSASGPLSDAAALLTLGILCWIPLYLLISLKTVYRQGWFLTVAKFSVIGACYLTLLAAVATGVALLSFLLL